MARRQGRLILADRGYFIFLALLPFVLAGLVLSVPGSAGFNVALPDNPNEPGLLLALTNLGASFLGLALTIRDLIGERVIFRREQAVGLSATAYLLAKIITYCGAAIVQSAIMTAVIVIVRGGPRRARCCWEARTSSCGLPSRPPHVRPLYWAWCCPRWRPRPSR